MSMSPGDPVSTKYTVADLSHTSAPLPNEVPDEFASNLALLASVLEQLEAVIGPFKVASAFRSDAVQTYLGTQGLPVAKGKSYHTIGLGADIVPSTMSIQDAFGKILADPIKDQFAEISLKETQTALHLGVKYDAGQSTKVTALNDSGDYVALSLDEIQNYAAPFLADISAGVEIAAKNPLPLAGIVAAVCLIAYFVMQPKGRTT
jgi:hypothetical protein